MKHAVTDLLRAALIPELGADITAGTSCDMKETLIAVAALGAFPDELPIVLNDLDLTVITAVAAIIRLGIQLSVHNVVVNKLKHAHDRFKVILDIGNLNIADRAAG